MFSFLLISQIVSAVPLGCDNSYRFDWYGKLPLFHNYLFITCIVNPIVQCYFTKDMSEALKGA